jgi:hypothetical protein
MADNRFLEFDARVLYYWKRERETERNERSFEE